MVFVLAIEVEIEGWSAGWAEEECGSFVVKDHGLIAGATEPTGTLRDLSRWVRGRLVRVGRALHCTK